MIDYTHARPGRSWRALALALGLPVAAVPATFAQDATTQNQSESVETMDSFQVTGSRLKRIDAEGPNPVTAISRADLDIGGYTTVGEALRSLSYVSGISLIPAASNNSFTPGASTVNLRGLGNNNVLVLINGRRAAPLSSPGFDGLQTVFDFNSIPSAAVESIEVLKDGGSAIYGSDAVSGVINVKLRKNYSGLTTTVGLGNTVSTDSLEKSASLVYGSTSGRTSVVIAADWTERASIKDRDYNFSSTANLTSRGGPDLRSYAGYPALVYVPSLDDYYSLSAPKANPTLADFQVADVSTGSYDFQRVTDLLPETRNYGFYTRGTHDFSDTLYGFAEFSFRRSWSRIEAAPSPVFNFNENGDGATTGYLNIPAHNPNNPFGEDLEDEWYARLVHAGNRINDVTSDTPRLLVGLGGKINDSWSWETGVMHSENSLENLNAGSVFDNLYQDALNGIEIDDQTLYANPFGPEDPRVTATYVGEDPNSSSFKLRTYDFSASGDLFELPAGMVGLAFGGEYRTEKFENIRSINNITGNIVGGAEGATTRGDRNVSAAFAEVGVPILPGLEAQIAGRFERYSDFGSTTKPKIALSYRPTKWLLFRTSFGQSFLAPNLSYLYTSQVTQFSDQAKIDPKRPNDAARQIVTRGGGNPDLQPEETDAFYAGFQIEPDRGALKGFGFGVDFFEFKQTDLIAQLGPDFILANEDLLPGAVVRNPPAAGETYGVINYILDPYRNVNQQTYRGWDIEARYDLQTTSAGVFRFAAGGTFIQDFNLQGTEFAGTYNQPRWRGTFTTDWRKGDWSAALLITYIGHYDDFDGVDDVGSQIIVNPQVSYAGLWDTKITLGARNALDRDPPFDPNSSTGWNANINDPEKAFVYVRVTKDW
ncbi:MAG TPA: TonB-dependent receptor [Opitutaceae bacterium]